MVKCIFKAILIVQISLYFLPFYLKSQTVNIDFQRLSKDNGLSSYGPTAVLKDSKGFVWIASQNGLNRYDGSGVKLYVNDVNNPNSLSEDYVLCLCEDSEGNIWAGTISKGLNKFDRKTEKFEVFINDPDNENSISSNSIRALISDGDKLWIGTQTGGLNIYDIKKKKFTQIKHIPGNPLSLGNDFIWSLYKDSGGNIWVGTNGSGLDKLIKSNNTFIHFQHVHNDPATISHNEIRSFCEDKDGNLWIGTNGGGVCRLDSKNGKISRIIFNPLIKNYLENTIIMGLMQDESGYIWIGDYVRGLTVYDPGTDKIINVNSNADDSQIPVLDGVYSIYKDNLGIIWICHEGKGVYIYNKNRPKFIHYKNIRNDPNSLSDNIVFAINEDINQNIWMGNRKGLSIMNPANGLYRHIEHDPGKENTVSGNYTRNIFRDNSGNMWISSNSNALDIYNIKTGLFKHYLSHPDDTSKIFSNVVAMLEDKKGQLWIATYSDGLKVLNKEKTKVTTYLHDDNDINSISSNGYWNICSDNNDNIWVLTYTTGLDLFDKNTGKFKNYRHNPDDINSLSSDIVTYLYQDKSGIYWLTTFGGGLNRFDIQNNNFKHYTTNEGLPDNYLYGLLEDEFGRFWISTNQGLSRFDPKTEKFVNYDIGDGLQSQEFNQNAFLKSSSGLFYFGGVNGVNVFRPADFSESDKMPELVFTSFKIFNKEAELPVSVTETDEIELSFSDNFFTIEYAALEFTNPSKIKYAYMLEGVDQKWNYVNNKKTAYYTNISPNDYVFKVKYTNSDGMWNDNVKSIRIIITPQWWKRWWVKGIGVLLILTLMFYGINKRYDNVRKQKILQEEITRRIIESNEEERKKISAELHDSLGQDLVIIKNNADLALNICKTKKESVKYIKNIYDASTTALENVRAISHNLRPVELDKLGLTETINSIIERASSSSIIKFTSEIDNIDGVFEGNDDVNYCRIIQESVNNIIKHSKASVSSLQIKRTPKEIITIIKDNGIGFNPDELTNGRGKIYFGLMVINERVKILNGDLKINTNHGEGTELIFTFPLDDKHKTKI
jgi:signal transduction histidine kinase/ligand-binding sensor domain-containing protein